MTTLPNRPNTALIVIDMQIGVVAKALARDAVVANIVTLVERARDRKIPVIWVQDMEVDGGKGSAGWPLIPELTPRAGEPLVEKAYGDAFEETKLEAVLAELGVGRLVVTGAQTDACIRCTIHGGCARGYDVLLVSDAHTTEDLTEWGAPPPEQVIAHTNLYWTHHTAPGRSAGTAKTADVDFGSRA